MKPELVEEIPINQAQLKEELQKIKKKEGDLNFRAEKTLEFLQQVETLSAKEADNLFKKIDDLKIPRFKEVHIHKVIDVKPKNLEEIKNLFQGYTITVTDDNLKKILDVIN